MQSDNSFSLSSARHIGGEFRHLGWFQDDPSMPLYAPVRPSIFPFLPACWIIMGDNSWWWISYAYDEIIGGFHKWGLVVGRGGYIVWAWHMSYLWSCCCSVLFVLIQTSDLYCLVYFGSHLVWLLGRDFYLEWTWESVSLASNPRSIGNGSRPQVAFFVFSIGDRSLIKYGAFTRSWEYAGSGREHSIPREVPSRSWYSYELESRDSLDVFSSDFYRHCPIIPKNKLRIRESSNWCCSKT